MVVVGLCSDFGGMGGCGGGGDGGSDAVNSIGEGVLLWVVVMVVEVLVGVVVLVVGGSSVGMGGVDG